MTGAVHVLNNEHFRYEREVVGARDAALEFVTRIDGVRINGVDLIRWGDWARLTKELPPERARVAGIEAGITSGRSPWVSGRHRPQ